MDVQYSKLKQCCIFSCKFYDSSFETLELVVLPKTVMGEFRKLSFIRVGNLHLPRELLGMNPSCRLQYKFHVGVVITLLGSPQDCLPLFLAGEGTAVVVPN